MITPNDSGTHSRLQYVERHVLSKSFQTHVIVIPCVKAETSKL